MQQKPRPFVGCAPRRAERKKAGQLRKLECGSHGIADIAVRACAACTEHELSWIEQILYAVNVRSRVE